MHGTYSIYFGGGMAIPLWIKLLLNKWNMKIKKDVQYNWCMFENYTSKIKMWTEIEGCNKDGQAKEGWEERTLI